MTKSLLALTREVPDGTAVQDIPLQGARNMRDLGGWKADGGRRVRYGQIYRSDDWFRLTEEDLALLADLKVKTLIDFRSTHEAHKKPDKLPGSLPPRYISLPAFHNNPVGSGIFFLFGHRGRYDRWLVKTYRQIVDTRQDFFRYLFQTAIDPAQRPAVFHCAAGKDRTGLATALLLAALGVSEDDLLTEYSLTNRAVDRWALEQDKLLSRLKYIGFHPRELIPLVAADPNYLKETFDHLRSRWGSLEGYLAEALHLDQDFLKSLRDQLLE